MAQAAADLLRLAGLGKLTRRARGRRCQRTAAVLAGRLLRGGLRILGLGRAAATGTRGIAARRLFGTRGILGRRRGLWAGLSLLGARTAGRGCVGSRALAGLENERRSLRAGMDAAASALAKARQDYAAAEAAVTALTAQQMEAGEAADLPALESQRDALTARRTALAAQEKALTARLLPNRKAADLYRQHAAARAELERRWQWVNALASTAGGTLSSKQKIRLEAYIQMNYLDAILVHANTRLMQMTAGQYELERVGAENQRSQSGLDLGVIDHYNGTRRSVKTLSGGESFKASLALALGLSDEVQSAAGGIRLDTLFLDEGFGSLDDESLEQAIRVLAGLTEGDRLVGIISHVAALKERIDKQVVVKKARSGGSTVEVIV